MRIGITGTQQKRWLRWWGWASNRWTGRAVIVFSAALLGALFPGIWTSWIGLAVLGPVLILLLVLLITVGVRAYRRED